MAAIKVKDQIWNGPILWNSMTLTSFVFTELVNTMTYWGGVLYNLVFTEWRHSVLQNEVLGRGVLYNLVSTSGVTAFHGIAKIYRHGMFTYSSMQNFMILSLNEHFFYQSA